ncbi:MAG: translation initiation factor eIF-1A [Candidatus Aenigmarchaeota archaeon]|nr:translation initiation factor eIF-1A [Candidatus Aenigmarchaeota archaeon]
MEQPITRIRTPREGDMLGRVVNLLGANRLMVECEDGKERICRIPGKLKKRVWTRVDDVVIIKPWDTQSDSRGDLVWRYTKTEVEFMKRRGYLNNL